MNIKKIGLSALAGSLAVVSANAVELTVSGKTEVTYVSNEGTAGNPFGMGNSIGFTGTGDVNGMTATYFAAIGDQGQANSSTSETFASASLLLDMGDMGTIGFDQGVGVFGVGTIDDKTPYAYEESWSYTGGSNGLRAAGGSNAIGYRNSFAGYQLSLEIDPGHGATTGGTADGGTAGAAATDHGFNFAITGSPADGVSAGIGYGQEEADGDNSPADSDAKFYTAYANYAFGAATVGLQRSSANGGSSGTSSNEVLIYGISYSVNENLSISYSEMENEYGRGVVDKTVAVTEDTRGLGASYTMGSASVRVLTSSTDNAGGNTNSDNKNTEISLMLAF